MVKPLQSLTLPLLAIALLALVGIVVATAPPTSAQGNVSPVTNIAVCSGPSAGEVVISWDSAPQATYYRIGYVNMVKDYPRAKASATGEWIEAFVYVDVNAQNIAVSGGRGQYTLRRLVQGDRHAFTVLTSNNVVNTVETISGAYSWPQNPRWAFHTVTNPDFTCSTAALPDNNTPLSNAELARRVRPTLGQIISRPSDGKTYAGTGFVVSSDGLMVTNRHVVDDAATVTVNMLASSGQVVNLTGQVLGRGILADLAVIRLPAGRTYANLPLGDSAAVAQGDDITAWGYPSSSFLGDDPTLTRGIISSTNRTFDDTRYLQTDAAIAGGSSGGPVVDRFGCVVGVNTAVLVSINDDGTTTPIPGIYLAIASNEVRSRLDTMAAGGPAQATYRNLRHDYRYTMTFPKGWYLNRERPTYSQFVPYGTFNRDIVISTGELRPPFFDRSKELSLVAQAYWDTVLPDFAADNWSLFQRIGVPTKVNIGGQEFYRLEYRRQTAPEYCVENVVEMLSISSSFPSKPYTFWVENGICEGDLNVYRSERDTLLNSFRP